MYYGTLVVVVYQLRVFEFYCTEYCCFYSAGRALGFSGAALFGLGLATNNEAFQRVGGGGIAAGLGLKGAAQLFGRK